MPDGSSVLLVDPGRRRIPVIKVLRSERRIGLKEAKAFADAGGVVAEGLPIDDAQRLVERLIGAGAQARILVGDQPVPGDGSAGAPASVATHTSASIADEIQKLVDLRDSGALTEEEFQAAKRRAIYP
jgi:hypothetical protein